MRILPVIDTAEDHRFILKTSSVSAIDRFSGTLSTIPWDNLSVSVYYEEQYNLSIYSEHGAVEGAGWYPKDTVANFSIKTDSVQNSSILFTESLVFVGWGEHINQTDTTGSVIMDNPKKIITNWKKEKILNPLILPRAVGGAILAFTPFVFELKKRGRMHAQQAIRERYEKYLVKLDGLRETGRIGETVYLKLRREYERKSRET
jgi:hypothetical protein